MSSFCWSCLSRLRPTPRATALLPPTQAPQAAPAAPAATATAQFHTSTARNANPTRKSKSQDAAPKHRQSTSIRIRKKGPVERARPPPIGERKALRKRIILSNPNALEVEGMQDLSAENMVDARLRGSVVGLPMPMLEQLRAVQAFKPKQGWSIFRRPGTVLRRESLEMGRLFDRVSAEDGGDKGVVVKKVVTGVRGAGKSVHLLQAMAMGFLKNWVVFTVPESELFPSFPLDFRSIALY